MALYSRNHRKLKGPRGIMIKQLKPIVIQRVKFALNYFMLIFWLKTAYLRFRTEVLNDDT